ncbi:hypothetical protein [Alicyclobacillus sp. SO9]|uniref:hypothetical protein n=1 Tax=Alicyclobacillus sp. SO9 TaxID=2665646 RepID=UPI0018E7089E|nr:hypothetical protein [Alicyclobacillus sp. SO9]QQE80455.1 hypothetical protein GI364_08605 [Alicyclobacillus sp. SO9]
MKIDVEYYNKQLELAIEIALKAHAGQVDKGGIAYILHPLAVSGRMRNLPEKVIGILHDVIEDSEWTKQDLLRAGIDPNIVRVLDFVTKQPGEPYAEYIDRLKGERAAINPKLSDIEENSDPSRLDVLETIDYNRIQKYLDIKDKLLREKVNYFGVMDSQLQIEMIERLRNVIHEIDKAMSTATYPKEGYRQQLILLKQLNKTFQGRILWHFKGNPYIFDKVIHDTNTSAWKVVYQDTDGLEHSIDFEEMFDNSPRYKQGMRFMFINE